MFYRRLHPFDIPKSTHSHTTVKHCTDDHNHSIEGHLFPPAITALSADMAGTQNTVPR